MTKEDDGGKKEDFGLLRRSEGALSRTHVPYRVTRETNSLPAQLTSKTAKTATYRLMH